MKNSLTGLLDRIDHMSQPVKNNSIVEQVQELTKKGFSANEIARRLGTTMYHVYNIQKGKVRTKIPPFTPEEEQFIKANFTTMSYQVLAEKLGRSDQNLRNKINKLVMADYKISKNPKAEPKVKKTPIQPETDEQFIKRKQVQADELLAKLMITEGSAWYDVARELNNVRADIQLRKRKIAHRNTTTTFGDEYNSIVMTTKVTI